MSISTEKGKLYGFSFFVSGKQYACKANLPKTVNALHWQGVYIYIIKVSQAFPTV